MFCDKDNWHQEHVSVTICNNLLFSFWIFCASQIDILVSGRTMVINVEYNQLDPLLRATGHPDGDVNSETGYSPFPGNINQVCPLQQFSLYFCLFFPTTSII